MPPIEQHHHQRFPRAHLQWGATRALIASLALCLTLLLSGCGGVTPHETTQQSAAAHHTLTLVVMGASDAFGIGTYDPDRENWPSQLARALPQPTHLVNLGIPGATLGQAQQEELPVAVGQQANILVIWLAVNDVIANVPLSTYTSQLRATLTTIHQRSPQTHIFVGNLPDLTQLPFFYDRDADALHAEVDAWNAAIAHACADEHATLADIYSGWGQIGYHPDFISSDGLHPSDTGAQALAAYFDALISQTLHLDDANSSSTPTSRTYGLA
ncbi:MAG: SGNH/GDSL hydrolase family protein [Ktedonobacterales bacterium]